MLLHTLVLFFDVGVHIIGSYPTKKVDVFIRVKLGHLSLGRGFCTLYQRPKSVPEF